MNSDANLADLTEAFARRGSATALLVYREKAEERRSYAALADDIAQLAAGLIEKGLRQGEAVLLFAPNSAAWITAYFAILRAGGLVVPLDDLSSGEELARVLADCGARRIFTVQAHQTAIENLDTATELDTTLLDDDSNPRSWRHLLTDSRPSLPNIDPDDVACLLYTSGTTGTPKSVPLSHRNILSNVTALVDARLAGPADRVLLPLPLHHAYPCTVGLLGTLACGGRLVLPAGISGPQIAAALKASGATILVGVPRLYTALLAAIESRIDKQGALARGLFRALLATSLFLRQRLGLRLGRFLFAPLHHAVAPGLRALGCGGAHLDPQIGWTLEALGWEVLTGYGLTETSPLLTFSPHGQARPDSAGRPLPGVELRIEPRPGQDFGEILARGPCVFAGYRNNPEATRQSFTSDGWFRSGDLGFLDRDGYLHIVGRTKEIIVLPGGKNVLPEDVEAVYADSPLIREAAVFEHDGTLTGLIVPDAEAIRARGAASAQALLRDAIEDQSLRLPPHQRLSGYRLTHETLPRTHLGKLRRHLLSDIYARAERGIAPAAPALSEEDRRLLDSQPAKELWAWLGTRFPGKTLTLDSSPQLDLQIDSLEWVTLSLEMEERFGIALTGDAIARIVTLRDLLQAVTTAITAQPAVAPPRSDDTRWLAPLGAFQALLGDLVFALNRLALRSLFRLRIEGVENLPAEGPYVIAPNHASLLDPLVVAAALPPRLVRQVYWAGWTGMMFAGPASRFLSRIARVFPVDPDRAPAASLALGEAVLARGQILVWFPEGRRTRDGKLGAFLPGAGQLLEHSGARALPVHITGSFEALPIGRRLPRLRPLTIVFGTPRSVGALESQGQGADTPARIADGLRRAVAELGGRATPPAR